jgi:hypothetical protein
MLAQCEMEKGRSPLVYRTIDPHALRIPAPKGRNLALRRVLPPSAETDCAILRIEKRAMVDTLHREHKLSDLFVAYLLARNIRYEEDLVDQLFNSSEKRLEAISQMPQENNAAGKVEHPEKILCVSFVAYDHPAEVLQP